MKKPIEINFKFKQLKNFIIGLLKDLIVTIIIILLIYEFSPMLVNRFIPSDLCWTYLRYNNKLYVICSPAAADPQELKGIRLTKAGTVRKEILFFLKPKANGVSNGIKRGTEIFTSNSGRVAVKFKNKYYILEDTAEADGWGNGASLRLE